jgi:hypothetical protein
MRVILVSLEQGWAGGAAEQVSVNGKRISLEKKRWVRFALGRLGSDTGIRTRILALRWLIK